MNAQDKVVIITGAGTGTGAACATALSALGARVVINYRRSEQEADAVLRQCRDGSALLVQGDVSSDADCRRIADAALTRWGRIDGLINSAGMTKFVSHQRLDGLDAQDWQDIYAVNVVGAYQMVRACVPAMRDQAAGAVVNVSSMSGLNGLGSSIAYAASKGALNTLTLSLARALAPVIRVNAVCPGMIETRWHRARFDAAGYEKFKTDYEASVPLGKASSAEDVADATLWLLLGAAQTTGELLQVDGGFHLGTLRR